MGLVGVAEAPSMSEAEEKAYAGSDRQPTPSQGGGTTALVCVATSDRRIHLASVGDSRAVLVGADGRATRLTVDHTPSLPAEYDRIVHELGGFVSRGRIHGILAVSRALGDLELQPFVSHSPQVSVHQLPEQPAVLILASDGLWGCVDDAAAAAIAAPLAHEPQAAAEALLAEVEQRGGRDNVSVLVAAWRR